MKYWIIAALFLAAVSVQAQQEDPSAKKEYLRLSFDLSLVHGMSLGSSLARETGKEITHAGFAWNVVTGKAARLDGAVLSTIWGEYTEYATGAMLAGIMNTVEGEVRGAQLAGLFNRAGSLEGAQGAGIFNMTDSVMTGAQGAGIFNISTGDVTGAQGAGIFNLVRGAVQGAQGAGIFNLADGDVDGAQGAGIFNGVDGTMCGVQAAGIMNMAGSVSGVQMAGIVNFAEDVNGVQLGLLNFAKTHEGAPLGLVSYVEEVGLRADVWAEESGLIHAGLRSGSNYFYNVLGAGASVNDPFRWTVDFGFGGIVRLSDVTALDIGLLYSHVNEDESWTNEVNDMLRLHTTVEIRLAPRFALLAGISMNGFASKLHDGSDLAPWSSYSTKEDDIWIRVWPGFSAGLRF